ncbi:hypothetical protein FOZ63_001997, partial [Perkinsus olseni]
ITTKEVIVVSDPELIRQVLTERPNTYIRRFNKINVLPFSGMFTTEGIALGHNPREVQRALKDIMVGSGHAFMLSNFPWMTRDRFPWNLNPLIKKLHLGVKRLNELCDEIASRRKAERQARVQATRPDLLDKLLHLDREDLRGNIITFFIAGSDTSAMAVAWCLYYLCLNTCIQAKARAEVDALGRDPETMKNVDELPLVECCVLEALRLQPPAVILFHECITDTSLNGKTIPSGTSVATLLRKAMVEESQGGTTFEYTTGSPSTSFVLCLNQ